jgi:predicted RNA-binding Zn ribbon-like protein
VSVQASIPGERDHPALAFVNSLHSGRTGQVDHIATPEQLAEWLAWRGLAGREAVGAAAPSDADLAAAVALRSAIRELLLAAIEGRVADAQAVAAVNGAAAAAPSASHLRWDASGPAPTRSAPGAGEMQRAIAALAEDAIALVCGHGDELIACGAPGCVRLLLKDHPRRHWCSTRCGDRVRAARHYRRARGAPSTGPLTDSRD